MEDLLSKLLEELSARLAARLSVPTAALSYSSQKLPQGVSRRCFAETCRSGRVEGAWLDGRVWHCSVAAWEAARTTLRPRASSERATPTSLDAKADALLTRAGLRIVGGRR
jgi:hypothetical protein